MPHSFAWMRREIKHWWAGGVEVGEIEKSSTSRGYLGGTLSCVHLPVWCASQARALGFGKCRLSDERRLIVIYGETGLKGIFMLSCLTLSTSTWEEMESWEENIHKGWIQHSLSFSLSIFSENINYYLSKAISATFLYEMFPWIFSWKKSHLIIEHRSRKSRLVILVTNGGNLHCSILCRWVPVLCIFVCVCGQCCENLWLSEKAVSRFQVA